MDGLPQHRGMLKGYVMGAFACTAMLMAPSSAAAATALGETNNPFTGVDCTGPSTYLQVSTGREPSYTAPANGVITSWRTFAAAGGAQVKLGVFRQTGPPTTQYTTAGASATQTLKAGSLTAFSTSIPVLAGDTLGLLIVTEPQRWSTRVT